MAMFRSARQLTLFCVVLAFLVTIILVRQMLHMSSFNNAAQTVSEPEVRYTTVAVEPSREKQQDEKIVLLFWSKVWGVPAKREEGVWEKGNKTGQCPVACEVTIDRSRINEAKSFIVHGNDLSPLPPSKHIPWILYTQENPIHAPVLGNQDLMSQFHILHSYRLDSDFPVPVFTKPNLDPPLAFDKKTGGIMAAFTNCEPVRTAYLKQLMNYIKVDSYGGCLHNKEGPMGRYRHGDFRMLKQNLARSYKFLIVFFNEDCDYFVDEQIIHAFNAGSVPIVMSTDKVYEFLPGNLKNAIVDVRNVKSPKDLADRLTFLMSNEMEYNKFLEWKVKGLGDISDTVIGKYWELKSGHWCPICEAVSQGRWHKEGLKKDDCKPRDYKTWGIEP